MKSFFFCLALVFCVLPARAQTNELWYKNWQNPFLVLFEEDTFDIAESRLFLPYRIFESSKRKTELIYKYTNYKEQGYYRCNYEKGKLKSRVLYADYFSHVFPISFGRDRTISTKLHFPLKYASYFTHFKNGRVEEKAFRADTFLQTVNYFMANGQIDSVQIRRPAYSLNYSVTYDSSGRLLTVQAVENGKSYLAQKRVYTTYFSNTYHFSVADTLFGYFSSSPTSVAPDSFPQREIFIGRAKDTSYLFAASHNFYDNDHRVTYGLYRIQNGTFREPERSSAGRCGQSRGTRGSDFLNYTHTKQEFQRAIFLQKTVGNKRSETFSPDPFYIGGNSALSTWGYTLRRNRKRKGYFSVYSTSQHSFGSYDFPSAVDSNRMMEVSVR